MTSGNWPAAFWRRQSGPDPRPGPPPPNAGLRLPSPQRAAAKKGSPMGRYTTALLLAPCLLLSGCDRQQQAAPASHSRTAPSPVWPGNSSPPCWPTDPITHRPIIETATAPRVGRPQTARSPFPVPAAAARRSTAFCTGKTAAATARSVRAPASAPPPHPPPVSTPHNKAQKSRVPLPVCGSQPAQVRAPS